MSQDLRIQAEGHTVDRWVLTGVCRQEPERQFHGERVSHRGTLPTGKRNFSSITGEEVERKVDRIVRSERKADRTVRSERKAEKG